MKKTNCVLVYLSVVYVANSSGLGYNEDSIKNHHYVGLPIGTWKITDLNKSEKEELCIKQKNFCSEECGGESLVNKNYCNQSTMSWMCSCQHKVPNVPPYHWPVTLAECYGREASCKKGCSFDSTKTICIHACYKYFKCDKAGSPSSGLRVENEQDKPNYRLTNNAYSIINTMKFNFFCVYFFHAYVIIF